MKTPWKNFWYNAKPAHEFRVGGSNHPIYTFRKQRLINILFGVAIFIIGVILSTL